MSLAWLSVRALLFGVSLALVGCGESTPPGRAPDASVGEDLAVPADMSVKQDLSALGLIDGGYYYTVDGDCSPACGSGQPCQVPILGCGSALCTVTPIDLGVCFCYWTCGV
jgi:hypothetical protein